MRTLRVWNLIWLRFFFFYRNSVVKRKDYNKGNAEQRSPPPRTPPRVFTECFKNKILQQNVNRLTVSCRKTHYTLMWLELFESVFNTVVILYTVVNCTLMDNLCLHHTLWSPLSIPSVKRTGFCSGRAECTWREHLLVKLMSLRMSSHSRAKNSSWRTGWENQQQRQKLRPGSQISSVSTAVLVRAPALSEATFSPFSGCYTLYITVWWGRCPE